MVSGGTESDDDAQDLGDVLPNTPTTKIFGFNVTLLNSFHLLPPPPTAAPL